MATPEAVPKRTENVVDKSAPAAAKSGEVLVLDGLAGHINSTGDPASGDPIGLQVTGVVELKKSSSVEFLDGQVVGWDIANNQCTYRLAGDVPIGVCTKDAAAGDAYVRMLYCNPGQFVKYAVEQNEGEWTHEATLGLGGTVIGGAIRLEFDAVAEAALASLLSVESLAIARKIIWECEINVSGNGDDAALDINVGIASASHATSADSIAEYVFFHIDGNVLNILAQSEDGTTTVAAVDTTIDYVEGTYFFVQIDARNSADIQLYVNGANVLLASVFRLDNATGPMKGLAHVEKTSNDTVADVRITRMRMYPTI